MTVYVPLRVLNQKVVPAYLRFVCERMEGLSPFLRLWSVGFKTYRDDEDDLLVLMKVDIHFISAGVILGLLFICAFLYFSFHLYFLFWFVLFFSLVFLIFLPPFWMLVLWFGLRKKGYKGGVRLANWGYLVRCLYDGSIRRF